MMNKRILILVAVVTAVLFGGWMAYDQTHLRVVSVSPKDNAKASTTDTIIFTFNHSLAQANDQKFRITPYVEGAVTIKNNILTFTPAFSYKFDQSYTASILSPISNKGLIGKDAKVAFNVTYVPFNKKSKAQQATDIANTDSAFKNNPLAASLPYETTHFKLDYASGGDGGELVYILTLYAIINKPSDRPMYVDQLKRYKAEAFTYIRSKSADPTKLQINYEPTEAANY